MTIKISQYELDSMIESAVLDALKVLSPEVHKEVLAEQESVVKSFFRGADSLPGTPYEIEALPSEDVTVANALFQSLGFAIRAAVVATSPTAQWLVFYRLLYETKPPDNIVDLIQQIGAVWGDAAMDITKDIMNRAKGFVKYTFMKFVIPMASIPLNFFLFSGLNRIIANPVEDSITTLVNDPAGFQSSIPVNGYNLLSAYQDIERNHQREDYVSLQRNAAVFCYKIAQFLELYKEGCEVMGYTEGMNLVNDFYNVWNDEFDGTHYEADDFAEITRVLNTFKDNVGDEEIALKLYEVVRGIRLETSGRVTFIAGLAGKPSTPLPLIPNGNMIFITDGNVQQLPPHKFFNESGWLRETWKYLSTINLADQYEAWIEKQMELDPGAIFSPGMASVVSATKGKSILNTNSVLKTYFLGHAEKYATEEGLDAKEFVTIWTGILAGSSGADTLKKYGEDATTKDAEATPDSKSPDAATPSEPGKTTPTKPDPFENPTDDGEPEIVSIDKVDTLPSFGAVTKTLTDLKLTGNMMDVIESSAEGSANYNEDLIIQMVNAFAAGDLENFNATAKKMMIEINTDLTRSIMLKRMSIEKSSLASVWTDTQKAAYSMFQLFGSDYKENSDEFASAMQEVVTLTAIRAISIVAEDKSMKLSPEAIDGAKRFVQAANKVNSKTA